MMLLLDAAPLFLVVLALLALCRQITFGLLVLLVVRRFLVLACRLHFLLDELLDELLVLHRCQAQLGLLRQLSLLFLLVFTRLLVWRARFVVVLAVRTRIVRVGERSLALPFLLAGLLDLLLLLLAAVLALLFLPLLLARVFGLLLQLVFLALLHKLVVARFLDLFQAALDRLVIRSLDRRELVHDFPGHLVRIVQVQRQLALLQLTADAGEGVHETVRSGGGFRRRIVFGRDRPELRSVLPLLQRLNVLLGILQLLLLDVGRIENVGCDVVLFLHRLLTFRTAIDRARFLDTSRLRGSV